MCCDGMHDVAAKLDVPGHVRFVTLCSACGREQREVGRDRYAPEPRLAPAAAGAPQDLARAA